MVFDFLESNERAFRLRELERRSFEDRFLSGFRVPEQAVSSINQTQANRLAIDDRAQNRDTLLETSRLEAQFGLQSAQRDLSQFGQVTQLDNLRRQRDILDTETDIEALMFDREFESIELEALEFGEPASFEYLDHLFRRVGESGNNRQVRARAEAQYREAVASQIDTIAEINDVFNVPPSEPGSARELDRIEAINRSLSRISRIDPSLIRLGLSEGVLNPSDLGPIVMTALELGGGQNFEQNMRRFVNLSRSSGGARLYQIVEEIANQVASQPTSQTAEEDQVSQDLTPNVSPTMVDDGLRGVRTEMINNNGTEIPVTIDDRPVPFDAESAYVAPLTDAVMRTFDEISSQYTYPPALGEDGTQVNEIENEVSRRLLERTREVLSAPLNFGEEENRILEIENIIQSLNPEIPQQSVLILTLLDGRDDVLNIISQRSRGN